MKTAGCIVALAGMVLFLISIVFLGTSVFGLFRQEIVYRAPLVLGEPMTTPHLRIDPGSPARLGVVFELTSSSIQEEEHFGQTRYVPRYEFPVDYTIRNDQGDLVASESTVASWQGEGTRVVREAHSERSSSRTLVEHLFPPFDAPAGGVILVQVMIGRDATYTAEVHKAELKVYDDVSSLQPVLTSGVAIVCIAPVLVVVGIILFIVGLFPRVRPVSV